MCVWTAEDTAPRTRQSKDSPSEISSINPPKRTCKKIELLNSTSSPSSISRCSTVSVAPFTPESSRSDQFSTEKTEPHPKESKETPQAKSSKKKTNDCSKLVYISFHLSLFFSSKITIFLMNLSSLFDSFHMILSIHRFVSVNL